MPGEAVDDPAELFTALFETPLLLSKVQAPERPLPVFLDALVELPKRSRKSCCLLSSPTVLSAAAVAQAFCDVA